MLRYGLILFRTQDSRSSSSGQEARLSCSVLFCFWRSAPVPGRSNVTNRAAGYSSIVCILNIAAAGTATLHHREKANWTLPFKLPICLT